MGFTLTRAAEADLINLYLEGATLFGVAQADRYHGELEHKFAFLAANPEAARERLEISPPVRCLPHASHLAVYVIQPNGDVLIVRVRHAREDWISDTS